MLCSDERKLSTLQQHQKLCFTMLPISADTASGARRPGISHGSMVQRTGLAPPLLPRPTRGFSVDRSSVSRPRTLLFASSLTTWTTQATTAGHGEGREKEREHGCATSWNGERRPWWMRLAQPILIWPLAGRRYVQTGLANIKAILEADHLANRQVRRLAI